MTGRREKCDNDKVIFFAVVVFSGNVCTKD